MGNTSSSSATRDARGEEMVDGGYLTPPPGSVYESSPQDWHHQIVRQLILDRRLSPFYKGLQEYDDDWDDETILRVKYGGDPPAAALNPAKGKKAASIRSNKTKEPAVNWEAQAYRGSQECPICFLFYPPNLNRTRCCDQHICTECFVQIKRAEPTTTHLESEPAACPYCAQDDFGVTYAPPDWRSGLNAGDSGFGSISGRPRLQEANSGRSSSSDVAGTPTGERTRRKSVSATAKEVVTTDRVRPDWKAKVDAIRAQAARRANRRIIMRQVGDRLIPVGVTSSRHNLDPSQLPEGIILSEGGSADAAVAAAAAGGSGRRRSGRGTSRGGRGIDNLLGGFGSADLEELMIMEAMRLSLLEEEERNRREQQQREQEEREEREAIASSSQPSTPAATAEGSQQEAPLPVPPPPEAAHTTSPSPAPADAPPAAIPMPPSEQAEQQHTTISPLLTALDTSPSPRPASTDSGPAPSSVFSADEYASLRSAVPDGGATTPGTTAVDADATAALLPDSHEPAAHVPTHSRGRSQAEIVRGNDEAVRERDLQEAGRTSLMCDELDLSAGAPGRTPPSAAAQQ